MSFSKCLTMAVLVGVVFAAPGCTKKAVDETKTDADAALDATRAGADKALDATKSGTGKAIDATKSGTDRAIDATKQAGEKTADVTKDVAQRTADKSKEIAGEVAGKSREVVATTGTAVTDGWITTKVKAKFADETVLKGSDINVDTTDHVVTLRGTVSSSAAKARAAAIAGGTEHVTRVVNQLVVRTM